MRAIAEVIGRGLKVPVVSLLSRASARSFWMARHVCGVGYAGFKCTDTATAGMAPNRARTHRRSRPNAVFRARAVGDTMNSRVSAWRCARASCADFSAPCRVMSAA